jgi:hypothetical protein
LTIAIGPFPHGGVRPDVQREAGEPLRAKRGGTSYQPHLIYSDRRDDEKEQRLEAFSHFGDESR